MSTSTPKRFRRYSAPTRALTTASVAANTTTTDTNKTTRAAIKAIHAKNSTPVIIGAPVNDTIIGVARDDVRRLYATTLYDPALKLSVPAAARSLDHLIDGGHTTDLVQISGRREDLSDHRRRWSTVRRMVEMLGVLAPLTLGYSTLIHGLDINEPRLITIGFVVTMTIYLIIGLKFLGTSKDIPALDFGTRKDRKLVADIADAADYLDEQTHVIDITDKQLAASLTQLQHLLALLEIQLIEEPELDSATTAAALHELWSDYEKLTTSLPGLNATITEERINREHAAINRAIDSMLTRYGTIQREIDEHRDLILEAHSEIAELTTTPALEQIESLSQNYDPTEQYHDLGEFDPDIVPEQLQPARTPRTKTPTYRLPGTTDLGYEWARWLLHYYRGDDSTDDNEEATEHTTITAGQLHNLMGYLDLVHTARLGRRLFLDEVHVNPETGSCRVESPHCGPGKALLAPRNQLLSLEDFPRELDTEPGDQTRELIEALLADIDNFDELPARIVAFLAMGVRRS